MSAAESSVMLAWLPFLTAKIAVVLFAVLLFNIVYPLELKYFTYAAAKAGLFCVEKYDAVYCVCAPYTVALLSVIAAFLSSTKESGKFGTSARGDMAMVLSYTPAEACLARLCWRAEFKIKPAAIIKTIKIKIVIKIFLVFIFLGWRPNF